MTARWILKRALTGATVHSDAPVSVIDPPVRSLSSAGSLRFTIAGAFAGVLSDVDGRPLIEEWGTRIYKVDGTRVLWGGIVIAADDSATTWRIEAATDSTVLSGTPYLGPALYLANTDPADIVRTLFNHVQGMPDGNLGIQVVGSTKVRTGSFSTQNAKDAATAYEAAKSAYSAATTERARLAALIATSRKNYTAMVAESTAATAALSAAKKSKDPTAIAAAQTRVNAATNAKVVQNGIIDNQQAAVDAQTKVVAQRKSEKDAAYAVKVAANKTKKDDGGAFELLWWEAPDCGQVLQDLADDAPFDYLDQWTMSGDTITSRVQVYYPRAGRKRTDVAFEQGMNIVEVVESTSGDGYASEVAGIGAGEGSGSIRRTVAQRNGRVRRVAVVTDKDIKSAASLDKRINRELSTRLNVLEVRKLLVRGTAAMPIGSWDLGDDVPVRATLRGHGEIDLLHRVVEQQDMSENQALLTLRRSDSFIYGG